MTPVIFSERWFTDSDRLPRPRDLSVACSVIALLSIGVFVPGWMLGAGSLFAPLTELTHGNGAFTCPLCGGTRAFASCCQADFSRAAQLNLCAVVVFFWTLLQIPLRGVARASARNGRVQKFCDDLDRLGMRLFLPLLFGSWGLGLLW